MKSGAINIDEYIGGVPEEQFDFIYTHFSIIKNLLIDYQDYGNGVFITDSQ